MIDIATFTCERHGDGSWTLHGQVPIARGNVKFLEDKIRVKGYRKTVEFTRISRRDSDYVMYFSDDEGVLLKWLID